MTTDTTPALHPPPARLAALLPLLACPRCGSGLQLSTQAHTLQCTGCAAVYPVRAGVPILLPESMQEPGVGTVSADDPVSRHPYSPAALEIIEAHRGGWVLDLGAGGKHQRWDNVIQIDIFRFPMTDVVCTADRLPFRDNAFQAVISQAVFEHLQYPEWAAAEIRRVLQPGGIAKIDTAFLQPEHGYPHHFFNATETGLRHWFRDFDLQWSGVEAYQHPKWSLSWFLGVYLDRIAPEHRALLQQTPLGEVLAALLRSGQGQPHAGDAAVLAALDALPAHELRTLAAGVSVAAINPPKTSTVGTPTNVTGSSAAGHDDQRKLLVAKEENAELRERLAAMLEQHVVAQDRSRYFVQFYPKTSIFEPPPIPVLSWQTHLWLSVTRLLRTVLPAPLWQTLRRWRYGPQSNVSGAAPSLPAAMPAMTTDDASSHGEAVTTALSGREAPFVSVVLAPRNVSALTDTFFSLVRQTYGGWELVLLETPQQSVAIRQAVADFGRLEERVRIVSLAQAETLRQTGQLPATRARYHLRLPEGAVLAFRAVQTLFTVAREHPQVPIITADFERSTGEAALPMRCYAQPVSPMSLPGLAQQCYVLTRVPETGAVAAPASEQALDHAHIPEVLFRHPAPLVTLDD